MKPILRSPLRSNISYTRHEYAKEIINQINPKFDLENIHAIQTHEFLMKTKRPKKTLLIMLKLNVFNFKFNFFAKSFGESNT